MTAVGLVAVALLILANGYFVAAEFAYVAARRAHLEQAAQAGDQKATRALTVRSRLSFVLSGAQFGITATSLVVGFIAEPTLGRALTPLAESAGLSAEAAGVAAFTAAFVLATAAQMVFGELAPKNLAIARPEAFARSLAGSVLAYTRATSIVVRLFDGAANWLLRRLGIETITELVEGVTAEELDLIVVESARQGTLSERQAVLVGRALGFRRLTAGDAMVPRLAVEVVNGDASGADLLRRLGTHTRFPVSCDGESLDAVVGVVHAKDLLDVPFSERAGIRVGDLARPPVIVPETLPLPGVLAALRQSGSELAVVVDEYGGSAGIVTLEDLAEELVGPIADERQPTDDGARQVGAGRWVVPGACRLDEVARETGVILPAGPYETVGGLIFDRLGRIPQPGDVVAVAGARLRVRGLRGRAVAEVELAAEAEAP